MSKATGGSGNNQSLEVVIVGAGPVGLACGIEAQRLSLRYVILEKGCLTNSILNFPKQMVFFSTPELLEIGNVPFVISGAKPTRQDALNYYRRVTQFFDLEVHLREKVLRVARDNDEFITSSEKAVYRSQAVVLSYGFYDHPNLLGIPGEDLPKVSHYYTEPFAFFKQRVAVVGGKNSAVEAALDLYRHDAEVTLIHRGLGIKESVKYWILPDILNRIKEGSINAHFNSHVTRITDDAVVIQDDSGATRTLANDFVFLLTGYHTDSRMMLEAGVEIGGEKQRPVFNPDSFETNVPGLYVAGVLAAGKDLNSVFIENGREHAKTIMRDIAQKLITR